MDLFKKIGDEFQGIRQELVNKFKDLSLLDEFYLNLLQHKTIPGGVYFYKENLNKYSSLSTLKDNVL